MWASQPACTTYKAEELVEYSHGNAGWKRHATRSFGLWERGCKGARSVGILPAPKRFQNKSAVWQDVYGPYVPNEPNGSLTTEH